MPNWELLLFVSKTVDSLKFASLTGYFFWGFPMKKEKVDTIWGTSVSSLGVCNVHLIFGSAFS